MGRKIMHKDSLLWDYKDCSACYTTTRQKTPKCCHHNSSRMFEDDDSVKRECDRQSVAHQNISDKRGLLGYT